MWASLLVGVLGLVAFELAERYGREPMMPLSVFRSRAFSATNVATFVIYAALSGIFFLLVVDLQVVAGFSALDSGIALLPMTILMLLLSARAGALAQKIGPRIPMTVGPLIGAVGLLLMSRIGSGASYLGSFSVSGSAVWSPR